jgi:hypothetical protein
MTHQHHVALLLIDEIDNIALWVLGAEVDEHKHNLASGCAPPILRLINWRTIWVGMLLSLGQVVN